MWGYKRKNRKKRHRNKSRKAGREKKEKKAKIHHEKRNGNAIRSIDKRRDR